MTDSPASAYAAARRAIRAAVDYADHDLTPAALNRRRAAMLHDALARLVAAVPVPTTPTTTIADVLAARAPRTADDIALQGREREKVRALRDAGHPLATILADASQVRVAAILDDLDVMPEVQGEVDPAAAADWVRAAALARLAELDAPDAVAVTAQATEAARTTAWARALTAAQTREVDMETRLAIRASDPDGYAVAFADDIAVDWGNVQRIQAAE